MVTNNLVEHDELKVKLAKEFDRLNITDPSKRDALTTEMNRLAGLLIDAYAENTPK